jgi:hypothetical protein
VGLLMLVGARVGGGGGHGGKLRGERYQRGWVEGGAAKRRRVGAVPSTRLSRAARQVR